MPDADLRRALLSIFTATGTSGDGSRLEHFLPAGRTTMCGYGRQALVIGLHRLGIGPGDAVLLPGFVCRELLGAVHAVGADVRFYDVDEDLRIVMTSLDQTRDMPVRAVLVVNYFGFPQPLGGILSWCRARGAVLIEDNAHGFLGFDGDTALGRRGDLGIFSLRKTLALPNGGALVDNRPGAVQSREGEPRFDEPSRRSELTWRAKSAAKRVMALGGPAVVGALIGSARLLRRVRTGEELGVAQPDAETSIPRERLAPAASRLLRRVSIEEERARRGVLFDRCRDLLDGLPDVRLLFHELPRRVVPQGFPFVYLGDEPQRFVTAWWRRGVPMVRWPDLPQALVAVAPSHYSRVMLVPFLW